MIALADLVNEMEQAPRPDREFRTHGYWELECLCGHTMKARELETVCPRCNRKLQIDWPTRPGSTSVRPS